jgi:hypothetical protein
MVGGVERDNPGWDGGNAVPAFLECRKPRAQAAISFESGL